MSRASEFSQAIADEICERLATSDNALATICLDEHMPNVSTVFKWLRLQPAFSEDYTRAREAQGQFMAEQTIEIADDGRNDWMQRQNFDGAEIGWHLNGEALARSRLRVETRKWHASHLAPKKYGEKVAVDQTINAGDGLRELLEAVNGQTRSLQALPKPDDDNTTE